MFERFPKDSFFEATALVRAASPIATLYAAEVLVGVTDLAVVGALGAAQLAAVGLGKTILLSLMTVGFAVISIGTVLMAERRNARRCGHVIVASFIVAVIFAVFAFQTATLSIHLLIASQYPALILAHFAEYTVVLAWAIGPAIALAAVKNVLVAREHTLITGWLALGIVLGNLLGSIVLVHGIVFWPGLGVAGAAWATVAVNVVGTIGLLAYVMRASLVSFKAMSVRRIVNLARSILEIGWAAGAQQALESVLFIVVLYLLGLHSPLWLAAGTVTFAVMELNFAVSGALGEVLAARLAALRTAGGKPAIRRTLRTGVAVSASGALLLALPIVAFPQAAVAIFSTSQTDAEANTVTALLRITAPFFLFDSWQIVLVHALRGLRQTVKPLVFSTACYWVLGIGGGLVLAGPAALGAVGIWAGFCAGLLSSSLVLAALAHHEIETAS